MTKHVYYSVTVNVTDSENCLYTASFKKNSIPESSITSVNDRKCSGSLRFANIMFSKFHKQEQ